MYGRGATMRCMDDVVTALAAQHAELAALVGPLDDGALAKPSACAGWSIADVLLHLSQSDELAVASLAGALETASRGSAWAGAGGDVEDLAADSVAAERTTPEAARTRWQAAATALDTALRTADLGARVTWVAGELSARTLATTRLAECWAHTTDIAIGLLAGGPSSAGASEQTGTVLAGSPSAPATDIAEPLGVALEPTDRLWHIARLVHRTVPYAFARGGHEPTGAVRVAVTGPGGEEWTFGPDDAPTTVTGPAADLCALGAQRVDAGATALRADGPDGAAVLRLARTFA